MVREEAEQEPPALETEEVVETPRRRLVRKREDGTPSPLSKRRRSAKARRFLEEEAVEDNSGIAGEDDPSDEGEQSNSEDSDSSLQDSDSEASNS